MPGNAHVVKLKSETGAYMLLYIKKGAGAPF
jgi:hypothetical protein